MQETSNYNLNKPEVTDPLRLEDFNENADIIDGAIKAVEQTVAGAYGPNNLPWETGKLNLTSVESGDVLRTFDFVPSAIVMFISGSTTGAAINGQVVRVDNIGENAYRLFELRNNTLKFLTSVGENMDAVHYLAMK